MQCHGEGAHLLQGNVRCVGGGFGRGREAREREIKASKRAFKTCSGSDLTYGSGGHVRHKQLAMLGGGDEAALACTSCRAVHTKHRNTKALTHLTSGALVLSYFGALMRWCSRVSVTVFRCVGAWVL